MNSSMGEKMHSLKKYIFYKAERENTIIVTRHEKPAIRVKEAKMRKKYEESNDVNRNSIRAKFTEL